MAEARVPITTTYSGQGFDQAQRDAAKLRKLQERHNRAVQSEFRQQIAQQKRLSALTKKLEREQARAAREAERQAQARQRQFDMVAGLAGAAAIAIGAFASQSFNAAAEAERLGRATDALGRRFGVAGDQIVASIQEASDFTISRLQAMQAANNAMLLNVVKSEKEFAELTQVAITLGRAMGRTAQESIADLTEGIGRQSPEILNNLGIIIRAETAYEKWAKQIGKNVDDLTDLDKQQAITNAALEQGRDLVGELGGVSLDTSGKVERITARWSDLKVAMGSLGDASGGLNAMNDFLDRLIQGTEGFSFAIEQMNLMAEAQRRVEAEAVAMGDAGAESAAQWREFTETFPLGGAIFRWAVDAGFAMANVEDQNEAVIRTYQELATAADNAANAPVPTAADGPEPLDTETEIDSDRIQRVADLRERAVRDILRIEEDAHQDSEEAWRDYYTEIDELGREFADDAAEARKDATKDLLKIEKDFAKDVKKLRSNLARDLEKIDRDESKDIQDLQERHAKETMRERRMRQIDALADERLFNFEIQQLAAEGEGNRIRELIARREIEKEIEAEKAEEAARQEDEKLQEDIDRVQEAAEERRAQLEEDHALRLNLLTEEAEEAKALRQQELAEKLADETVNFQERLEQQKQYRIAKLAEIEAGKQEALKKVGEEMSQAKEITRTELEAFKPVARSMGEQIGANVAQGINQGIQNNLRVQNILNGIGGGGGGVPRGFGGFQQGGPFGLIPRFADGGIVPGPVGAPRLIVAEGGETVLPTHRGGMGGNITVQVNAPGGLATDRLAAFLEGKLNDGFQEFLDAVIIPALE